MFRGVCPQRFLTQFGRDNKQLRLRAKNAGGILGNKRAHFLHRFLVLQDVGFVYHQHNLFAPGENPLQEKPFALSQRAVRGGGKQHQVAARHVFAGQDFVLADDGIRPRRIDDIQLLEHLQRVGKNGEPLVHDLFPGLLTPAHQRHAGCGWRHAFFQHAFAQQGVNQGAFPGIKLAHYHNQKEFVQLARGFFQGVQAVLRQVKRGKTAESFVQHFFFPLQVQHLVIAKQGLAHNYLLASAA